MKNPYELAKTILEFALDETKPFTSTGNFTSIDLYGNSVCEKDENDNTCNCFHLENESGVGDVTIYQVFPGTIRINSHRHFVQNMVCRPLHIEKKTFLFHFELPGKRQKGLVDLLSLNG